MVTYYSLTVGRVLIIIYGWAALISLLVLALPVQLSIFSAAVPRYHQNFNCEWLRCFVDNETGAGSTKVLKRGRTSLLLGRSVPLSSLKKSRGRTLSSSPVNNNTAVIELRLSVNKLIFMLKKKKKLIDTKTNTTD